MKNKLCAIVTLAITLVGCATDEDGAIDEAVVASDDQDVEIEGKAQALMPAIGWQWTLGNNNGLYQPQGYDLRMEHRASSTSVTATVTNTSNATKRDVVDVEIKVTAVCRFASGSSQTITSTKRTGYVTWQFPNYYIWGVPCPSGSTVASKTTRFTVKDKYVSP